jgi:uncharacterized protein YqeY
MIRTQIDTLILLSMKASDKLKTEVFRAVKTAFMNWETAKENIGKKIDDAVETSILRKLIAQYEDTAKMCDDGKHDELVRDARMSADILREYLPKPATEEEIVRMFLHVRENENIEPIKKNMGVFIKRIKELLPNADGKTVSTIVAKNLH